MRGAVLIETRSTSTTIGTRHGNAQFVDSGHELRRLCRKSYDRTEVGPRHNRRDSCRGVGASHVRSEKDDGRCPDRGRQQPRVQSRQGVNPRAVASRA